MSLIYRGQIAQASTTAHTIASGTTGTFLGRPFTIRQATQPSQRKASPLQFRGVLY